MCSRACSLHLEKPEHRDTAQPKNKKKNIESIVEGMRRKDSPLKSNGSKYWKNERTKKLPVYKYQWVTNDGGLISECWNAKAKGCWWTRYPHDFKVYSTDDLWIAKGKGAFAEKKSAVHLLNQVIQLVSSILVQTAILCPQMWCSVKDTLSSMQCSYQQFFIWI